MLKDKIPYILFIVTLGVFLVVVGLYLKNVSPKTKPAIPQTEEPATQPGGTEEELGPRQTLPEEIHYTITSIEGSLVKVKTDKGTATYTQDYMEERGIYMMVNDARQDLGFADLEAGQNLIVHTEEDKGAVGFEIVE